MSGEEKKTKREVHLKGYTTLSLYLSKIFCKSRLNLLQKPQVQFRNVLFHNELTRDLNTFTFPLISHTAMQKLITGSKLAYNVPVYESGQ